MINTILCIFGIGVALFALVSAVLVIAIAWSHRPEGIIKALKRRNQK